MSIRKSKLGEKFEAAKQAEKSLLAALSAMASEVNLKYRMLTEEDYSFRHEVDKQLAEVRSHVGRFYFLVQSMRDFLEDLTPEQLEDFVAKLKRESVVDPNKSE